MGGTNVGSRVAAAGGSVSSLLSMFGRDLTPSDGPNSNAGATIREDELERVIHILCCCTRRNSLLIAEPEPTIRHFVEALAIRIADGEVPQSLEQKKVIALDLPLLAGESNDWSDFQGRLSSLFKEAADLRNIILFIDDLATVFLGEGSESGLTPAAINLKSALRVGDLQCLGTAGQFEYRKLIEAEPSFSEYFQSLTFTSPTRLQSRQSLERMKNEWEIFHAVIYSDDALDAAVALAEAGPTAGLLLDKAARLLDEVGMRVKLGLNTRLKEVFDARRRIEVNASSKKAAMTNHDFATARTYENEERKARENLSRLNQQYQIDDTELSRVGRDDVEEAWNQLKLREQVWSQASTLE
jgi:ATP-dependent Clp protease ATP-binding subunit ClpC